MSNEWMTVEAYIEAKRIELDAFEFDAGFTVEFAEILEEEYAPIETDDDDEEPEYRRDDLAAAWAKAEAEYTG